MDYNTPQTAQQPAMEAMLPKKHPLRAPIVIIALVVVLALLFIGFKRMQEDKALDAQMAEQQSSLLDSDSQAKALSTQGTGTDTASLQADINATNVTNIDAQ